MDKINYDVIKKGQEVEALIQMPGWAHIKELMEDKMNKISSDLCIKRFNDIHEVSRLQGKYEAMKGVLNEIERTIGDYHRELQKETKEG